MGVPEAQDSLLGSDHVGVLPCLGLEKDQGFSINLLENWSSFASAIGKAISTLKNMLETKMFTVLLTMDVKKLY